MVWLCLYVQDLIGILNNFTQGEADFLLLYTAPTL